MMALTGIIMLLVIKNYTVIHHLLKCFCLSPNHEHEMKMFYLKGLSVTSVFVCISCDVKIWPCVGVPQRFVLGSCWIPLLSIPTHRGTVDVLCVHV